MNTNVDAARRRVHTSTLDLSKDIEGMYAASVDGHCVMIVQSIQPGAKAGESAALHAVIS